MKFDLEKLKNANVEEKNTLLQHMANDIKTIYPIFSDNIIDKICPIIIDEISKIENLKNFSFDDFIYKYLRRYILTQDVIDNYISQNNLKEKNELIFLLDICKKIFRFNFTVDDYYTLYKNNKMLFKLVEKIIGPGKKTIEDDYIYTKSDNGDLISFLEIYCNINNIEIIESEQTKNSIITSNIYSSFSNIRVLTREEEKKYFEAYENGDQSAKEIILLHNYKLVLSIASKKSAYTKQMTVDDLFQEGILGLVKAIDKFKVKKGFKFSTYATWWIRQAIDRSIYVYDKTVRIPVHAMEDLNKLNKAKSKLISVLDHDPTEDELIKETGFTRNKLMELIAYTQDVISLHDPVLKDADESTCLLEMIKDDKNIGPDEYVDQRIVAENIAEVLETLTPREALVIRLRFGLDNGKSKTLEEVGKYLGITRERVRQIEAKALRKLRQFSRKKRLNYKDDAFTNLGPVIRNPHLRICRNSDISNDNQPKNEERQETIKLEKIIRILKDNNYTELNSILSRKDFDLLNYIFNSDLFKQIYSNLNNTEKLIIGLKFGYYDKKYCDNIYIYNTFNIRANEVNNIIINCLAKVLVILNQEKNKNTDFQKLLAKKKVL